ncbi:hypothetical protein HK100_003840 [Physocladia obscura]|uniref:A to I editase domain-containing protein n=1 Tax=Physocladia obscura TaxID=109957 RepID=A0AAD5XFV9_9FUNG|nr:hypothetical protein HK100_003840 [Physocladia obscura]
MQTIETATFAAYTNLKKPESSGKWTVLASIVQVVRDLKEKDVVAIGTGVKCLNHSLAKAGADSVVADAHAEVVCRRAFIRYLISQMSLAMNGHKSIFVRTQTDSAISEPFAKYPLILDERISFEMYISQSPCGDASMASLEESQPDNDRVQNEAKRQKYLLENTDLSKSTETSSSLPPEFIAGQARGQVLRGRDDYKKIGCLRTKPGRVDSEMSISMSCSDKIAKWNIVGISGALLSMFSKPIYLKVISVGDLFDADGLQRALISRADGIRALAWTKGIVKTGLQILSTSGRKQGHAKKNGVWMETSESNLCNNKLFCGEFLELVHLAKAQNSLPDLLRYVEIDGKSYKELKKLSVHYNEVKTLLFNLESFEGWVVKDV